MKKVIKVVLIILIIAFLAITIYNINILSVKGLDKSNIMPIEEVIALSKKDVENLNYTVTFSENDYPSNKYEYKKYIKDNLYSLYLNGKPHEWKNIDTAEKLLFSTEGGFVQKGIADSIDKRDFKEKVNLSALVTGWSNCEVMGEVIIDGRNTIVVRSYERNKLISSYETRYFIDKETGIFVKGEEYNLSGMFYVKYEPDYEVRFNCVTDEDVKKPNLEGYTIYE